MEEGMEGRGIKRGGRDGGRALSLFVMLCRRAILVASFLCGLVVVRSNYVLIVVLLSHIAVVLSSCVMVIMWLGVVIK